jgi:cell division protease FtsH
MLTDGSDPVHKVTIIPRGMALGLTQTLPVEDRLNYTRKQILAIIKHAMGGRAAEELVFDHLSTGASNDLEQATGWARRMICEYGMSEKLGPVAYGDSGHDVFLGRDFATRKDYSEAKAQEIDEEIETTLHDMYAQAKQLLVDHRDTLDAIAEALLERETLETKDLEVLSRGEQLPPLPSPVLADDAASKAESASSSSSPDEAKEYPAPGRKLPDPEPMPG